MIIITQEVKKVQNYKSTKQESTAIYFMPKFIMVAEYLSDNNNNNNNKCETSRT